LSQERRKIRHPTSLLRGNLIVLQRGGVKKKGVELLEVI